MHCYKSMVFHMLGVLIGVNHIICSMYFSHLELSLKSSKLLTVDLSTRERKVTLFTVLLIFVGLLCQQ